jgi:hypothetical protein
LFVKKADTGRITLGQWVYEEGMTNSAGTPSNTGTQFRNTLKSCGGATGGVFEQDNYEIPFAWFVCGTRFANGPQEKKQSTQALYSLMSLWGWKFLTTDLDNIANASVLRVETDDRGDNFGYTKKVGGANGEYKVTALLPEPQDKKGLLGGEGHDTKVLMHPPRFGVVESDTFSYTTGFSDGTDDRLGSVATNCLSPGGCASEEGNTVRVSSVEKMISLQSLEEVYFVPLRYPASVDGLAPALLSREIMIDFKRPERTREGIIKATDTTNEINDSGVLDSEYAVSTYLLTRDKSSSAECDGLISFCNYEASEHVPDGANIGYAQKYGLNKTLEQGDVERNTIQYRYVAVVYGTEGKNSPFYDLSTDRPFKKPISKDTDPLTAFCPDGSTKYKGEDYQGRENFFAIGMDFNKDGEFLGYISRYCHPQSGSHGYQLAVIAKTIDQCTEFVSVYQDADISKTETNKAWTNRVWNNSTYRLTIGEGNYTSGIQRKPFGSVALSAGDIHTQTLQKSTRAQLLSYVFDNPLAGHPLYCFTALSQGNVFLTIDRCTFLKRFGYDAGAASVVGGWSKGPTSAVPSGREVLKQLFATSYASTTYPFDTSSVGQSSISGDQNIIQSARLVPPQIYSLNTSTCFPADKSVHCSAGEKDNITIGDQNGVDGQQIIARNGSYQARASFFAFADDNRMPIRRVMISWGDGDITNRDVQGMYKNRKPFCEPSNTVGAKSSVGYCGANKTNPTASDLTLLTCGADADCPVNSGLICHTSNLPLQSVSFGSLGAVDSFSAPRFGNLPRACEEAPFEYYHTYSCDENSPGKTTVGTAKNTGLITNSTYSQLISGGLADTSTICTYRPAVQVLDNWGWCNGTCVSGYDPGYVAVGPINVGCYENVKVNNTAAQVVDQCDPVSSKFDGTNPWTPYRGLIIVVPTN